VPAADIRCDDKHLEHGNCRRRLFERRGTDSAPGDLAHRIQRLLGCEAVWPKGAVDRAPISSGFENNEGQALGVVFLI